MTVFVNDTFTDSDTTLLENHTPDTGGTWVKRAGTKTLSIQSNAVESGSGTYVYYTNSATPTNAEYDVEVDIELTTPASTARLGLLGRFADASNFYRCYLDAVNETHYLVKRVSGSFTTLDTWVDSWTTGTKTIKFEVRDAAKKVYVASVERMSSADNALTAAALAGIYSRAVDTDGNWDDFVATDAGAPAAQNASLMPMHVWWARA